MPRLLVASLLVLFLIQLFSLPCFASTVALPQTGQTSCWDATGTSMSCTGSGEDGELLMGLGWPNPRFADNGDQTMTDKLTGLVWPKNANPAAGASTWQQALTLIKTLNSQNFSGHSDWRLPNINELRSLANMQQGNLGTWLTSQGFNNVQSNVYWSSGTDAFYHGNAWYMSFDSGYVYSDVKTGSHYLWPVRDGQPSTPVLAATGQTSCWGESGNSIVCSGTGQDGDLQKGEAWPSTRFVDNGDQTVTDNLTGLSWTKDADLMRTRDPSFDIDYLSANSWESAKDGAVSWQHALDYVRKLNTEKYLGYSDWRLPNREELASLIDWEESYPAAWLDLLGFKNVPADYYWSSDNDPVYTNSAWFVDMGSGYMDSYYKIYNYYVWPVRGGELPPNVTVIPGDCDADGKVSSTEVQGAVDMYLGLEPVQSCVDTGGTGAVDIPQLQKVINVFSNLYNAGQ